MKDSLAGWRCNPAESEESMKWYLVITTDVGTLDLGKLGNYYTTQEEAESKAELARGLPGTEKVEVMHT